MLENACAQKRRLHPMRSQCRKFGELICLNSGCDLRHVRRMLVAAGCDKRYRAVVLALCSVGVHAQVQRWENTQRERPEKNRDHPSGNQRLPELRLPRPSACVHGEASFCLIRSFRNKIFETARGRSKFQAPTQTRPLRIFFDLKDWCFSGASHRRWTASTTWITNAATVLGPARIYFIVFGILTIVGGVIGYVKAGSGVSIISGSIAGILLLVAAYVLPEHLRTGLVIVLIVSLLLAGRFIPNFFATGRAMPAGLMSILSVIGIVVAAVTWLKR